jgi:alkylhydroperoxidase family enzyme
MARIPYPDIDKLHPRVQEAFRGLPAPLNIFKAMAHAERNFVPLLELGGTILARQKLDGKLRELAILFVAADTGARYEWVQHVPIAKRAGATDAQVRALESKDIEAACFDEEERAVLRFTREVVRDVKASKPTFDAMARRFSGQEIVELILAIGFYMMVARLMETIEIDLEPPLGDAVVAAAERGRRE